MRSDAQIDPRAPVIVGAGQVVQRLGDHEPLDPIGLALAALRRASKDSGVGERLVRRADSVRHVATSGWPYRDEAALVAAELGCSPRQTVRTSPFGGDGPGRMVGDAARAIADGEADVVLVAGGEALGTLMAHQRAGTRPDWPQQEQGEPTRVVGVDRSPCNAAEMAVGLVAPVNVYALLEAAIRARYGLDRQEHLPRIAELWSRFSAVAATNPNAWLAREHTPEEITASRPVSEPYTKLLTANLQVDQAAAVILCSAQAARDAGVPLERWVFPLASSFAQDEWYFSEREELAASPAIRAACRAVLEHAGVCIGEVADIDLYSCFPSAVQIAAHELGLPLDDPSRPLTVTGGLTFSGGPGNNYSLHAIATLVGRLRDQPDKVGLSSALGWYCTKHSYGLYSGTPPTRRFAEIDANHRMTRATARAATADYRGPATIDAYTVPYDRNGAPEGVIVSAIAPDFTRALVRATDRDTIAAVLETDPLGQTVAIAPGTLTLTDGREAPRHGR